MNEAFAKPYVFSGLLMALPVIATLGSGLKRFDFWVPIQRLHPMFVNIFVAQRGELVPMIVFCVNRVKVCRSETQESKILFHRLASGRSAVILNTVA